MLSFTRYHEEAPNTIWLVWLHGLLGNQQDWQAVLPFMQHWPCLTIDLPGHGQSVNTSISSFTEMDVLLTEALNHNRISQYILVGYSLGGRLAMHYACYNEQPGLKGLVVEAGNLGLQSANDKQQRILNDHVWANRFRQQPLIEVLEHWYKQPIFADLTTNQQQRLIAARQYNEGARIADMLEATSLGRQPWLGERLGQLQQQRKLLFSYLCGENDLKFQKMATDCKLPVRTILQAGHNTHRSNPHGFTQQLISFLKEG